MDESLHPETIASTHDVRRLMHELAERAEPIHGAVDTVTFGLRFSELVFSVCGLALGLASR